MIRDRLSFRAVRPTDAGALAALHRDAFPEFFLSSLGTAFLRQFYLGFASDPTAVSTVAVTEDGEIVGSIVGTLEPAGFFSRLMKSRLIQFGAISAWESVKRPRIIPRLFRAVSYRGDAGPPVNGALLSSICVRKDQRGQGTGKAMMQQWALSAANSGAQQGYLATDADENDGVNRFYQSLGWDLDSTYSTPEGRRMNRYVRTFTDQKENPA